MAVVIVALSGCGSHKSTECVSSERGEVCATSEGGAITFTGHGLKAGSKVAIATVAQIPRTSEPEQSRSTLDVGEDGTLVTAEQGQVGFLSVFADTKVTFTVSATDEDGVPIEGDLVLST